LGKELVVICKVAELTVIARAFVAFWAGEPESIALTVKFEVPAVGGVPEIAPVELFKERPAGKEPEMIDQV